MAKLSDKCKVLGDDVARAVKSPLAKYGRSMLDETSVHSKPLAERFTKVVDSTKEFMGRMGSALDKVQKLAGGWRNLFTSEGRDAMFSTQRLIRDGDGFESVMHMAIENRGIHFANLSQRGKDIILALRELLAGSGAIMGPAAGGGVGAKITLLDGQVVPVDFGTKGEKAPRYSTGELQDIYAWGPTDKDGKPNAAWEKLVDVLADWNKGMKYGQGTLTRQNVHDILMSIRHKEGTGADRNLPPAMRRINSEFARYFDRFPAAIEVNGRYLELLHRNPYDYASAVSSKTASRAAVIREFGQSLDGDTRMKDAREAFVMPKDAQGKPVGGDPDYLGKLFDDSMMLLHDMPIDKPMLAPGTAAYAMARGVNDIFGVFKSLFLTGATVANSLELAVGNALIFFGNDYYKAALGLMSSGSRKAMIDSMEQVGAVTRSLGNFSFDPSHPLRSLSRIASQGIQRLSGNHVLNETQEVLAAMTADNAFKRFASGKGKPNDAIAVRHVMGWDKAKADDFVAGKFADQSPEHLAFLRRAGAALVGTPKLKAEDSRWGNSRLFKAMFAFTGYGRMKMENNLKLFEAAKSDIKAGKLTAPTARLLARYITGTTLQGIGSYLLASLVFGGGKDGLELAFNEMSDQPVKFLMESFLYGAFTGPLMLTYRALQGGGERLPETLVRGTFPGMMLLEATDYLRGQAYYKDQSYVERAATFFDRRVPASRLLNNIVGADGASDPALDPVIKAYNRWAGQRGLLGAGGGAAMVDLSEKDAAFRMGMRRAVEAMKARESPAEHLRAALGTGKDVSSSLKARRLLDNLKPADLESLKRRIGEPALRKLQAYDAMLERWAETYREESSENRKEARAAANRS